MRFAKSALCATALAVTSLFTGGTASAQAQGFALNRFDPADRGSDWFVLDSIDLRGHMRPAIGIVGDWGYKPLVVYNSNGDEKAAIVEHQVFAHLGGSLVLWDRLRAGLNIPIALYQTGDAPTTNGTTFKDPGTSFGDIRVSADVRLLGEHGSVFNSAIGFALYLPTGSRENFTGDGSTRFSPRASVAGDIDIFTYAGRLGLNYRSLTEADSLGTELTIAASAGVRLLDKKQLLLGPEIYGSTVADSFGDKRATPLEWLLGAHYTHEDFRFGVGMGSGLTRGWGTPIVRTVLSAEWAPGVDKDSDGDHIIDKDDACPTVPGVRTNNPRTNGCPLPVEAPKKSDRDGDGITDDEDACPDVAGTANVDPKKNGCPPDRDGDSIFDKDDACPDVPGIKSDDPAKNGCPPDRDGDGITDAEDACPDVAGVKNEDPKKNGCPPDRDGDSILDPVDACPDDPGPADPDPKKNGCPLARIEGGQVKIKEQVKFKTGSADILRESDPLLTAVGTILKDHPELTKVRVEGHTDNKGAAAMNKNLSERRAASVVKWLTTFGVDKKRLVAKGFGLEKPIDSNETEEGRTNNRRVEFHIEPTAPPAEKPAEKPAQKPAPKPAPKKP
jgi:outer membrane protein OmpA-like peptidoglycan-associated protein